MLSLLVIRGPSAGKAYPLSSPKGVIGRQQDCSIVVPDLTISRHHLEYAFENGQMTIRDLESQNGTYLERNLIKANTKLEWAPGEVIHIGSTDLAWVVSRGPTVPELETIVLQEKSETARIAALVAEISRNELPLIGHSHAIQETKLLASSLARFQVPLLIEGEIGTGKGLLSALMHRKGPTHRGVFQSVNCAFLKGEALEQALFGPESLLMTFPKEGSTGGTLFLDQIEELPADLQGRLFDHLPTHADIVNGKFTHFRLICAANRSVAMLVKKGGAFRADLLKRIRWLGLTLPPLRDRPNDIPQILDFCLRLYQTDQALPPIHFTPEMIKLMQCHDWPGNVREFKYFVHQILGEARRKKFNLTSMRSIIDESEVLFLLLDSLEKEHQFESFSTQDPIGLSERKRDMLKVLRENNWRVAKAAQSIGISRTEFFKKMKDTVQLGV
ncbi:MAG: sigma 54-dependent Fis family transcriptional regulator [Verrucomicrobiae bacterium]|nr:sigma 54-dependent Fis family transcriptional regulator [Verrucomicrobiae bacterium]